MSQRIQVLFIGFLVGLAFTIVPIPILFFYDDLMNVIITFFRSLGFLCMIVFAAPILLEALDHIKKSRFPSY